MNTEQQFKPQALQWIRVSAVLLFLAVAFGAFGAHGLEKSFSLKQLSVWEKGVDYLFIHGLVMFMVSFLFGLFPKQISHWQRVNWSFFIGIFLFSGSLFAWSLTGIHGLVFLTPLGGLLFLAAWLQLVMGVSVELKRLKKNSK
ncbi:DUF423 domain-containing protein [Thiomicrorhabdus indica]|uniref:DUF423 domain-containing protein n=1 Tax=Thiomicrorhabdus indica TaxID=2267253 RepID=UPI002AA8816F|nr:DUF423 domain-containing protein [Thiomicrorhabdus indica]